MTPPRGFNSPYILTDSSPINIKTEYPKYYFTPGESRNIYVKGERGPSDYWNRLRFNDNSADGAYIDDGWTNNQKFTTPVIYTANYSGTEIIILNAADEYGGVSKVSNNFAVEVVDNKFFKIYYSYVNYNTYGATDILENISGGAYPKDELKRIFREADNEELTFLGNTRSVNLSDNDLPKDDALGNPQVSLQSYFTRNFGVQDIPMNHYVELVGISYILSKNGMPRIEPGVTVAIPDQNNGYVSFICDLAIKTVYPSNNDKMQRLRIVAAAHELAHTRFFTLNDLADTTHSLYHNGLNNDPCIMSAGDRTTWTDPSFNNNLSYMYNKQIEAMSFCEGHKQRLSTINWVY